MLYQYCSECGTWCRATRLGIAFRSLGYLGVDMWVWNIEQQQKSWEAGSNSANDMIEHVLPWNSTRIFLPTNPLSLASHHQTLSIWLISLFPAAH